MEPIFNELKKAKEAINLQRERKEMIRNNLLHFIEAHEVTGDQRPLALRAIPLPRAMPVGVIFLILAILGGGTALAAEKSLPGDILYAVKTQIVEPIVTALPLPTQTRANWQVALAERRLEEAATLAEQGRLDQTAEQELNASFQVHATEAQQTITRLEDSGNDEQAADVASHLEGSLSAHRQILSAITAQENSGNDSLIKTEVSKTLEHVLETRVGLEDKIKDRNDSSTARASQDRIKVTSKFVRQSQGLFQSEDTESSSETSTHVETQLKASEDLLKEALRKHQTQHYGEAFNLANQAMRDAQESKILNEAKSKFNLRNADFASSTQLFDQVSSTSVGGESQDSSNQEDSLRHQTEIQYRNNFEKTWNDIRANQETQEKHPGGN